MVLGLPFNINRYLLNMECVYKITNKISGEYYIGSTKDYRKRCLRHLNDLRNNKHHSVYLQRSFNKYGEGGFLFEVVKETSDYKNEEQLLLDTLDFSKLYNISKTASGGDMIFNHPDRDMIIEVAKRNLDKGRIYIKPRFGADNPNWKGGKTICPICGGSKDSQSKVCIKCVDKTNSNNPFYGKTHTEITKKILSEKRLGKYNGNQERPVMVGDIEFKSLSTCAKHFNVVVGTISNRLKSPNFPEYYYK